MAGTLRFELRPTVLETDMLPLHQAPWWGWMDSNHRPHAYQACALTN